MNTDIRSYVTEKARKAKAAARALANLPTHIKNAALMKMASAEPAQPVQIINQVNPTPVQIQNTVEVPQRKIIAKTNPDGSVTMTPQED